MYIARKEKKKMKTFWKARAAITALLGAQTAGSLHRKRVLEVK